jgi:hypothetical protein
MVNAPDSDDPEDEDFVLPQRRGDEPLQGYIRRILDAADELASRAT